MPHRFTGAFCLGARAFALIVFFIYSGMQCGNDRFKKAAAFLESGDYLAARKVYEILAASSPDNFAAHYGLGMTWCAEAIYKTELGLASPGDWYPAIYRMTVASRCNSSDESRRILAILHFNLGACYKKIGNKEEAIVRVRQAVAYDSTLLKAHNLLGALYHELGNLELAQRCYRRTLILKPDYALAHFNLGALAWARKEYPVSEKHFADAVALEPANPYFQTWLTRARSRAGGKK